MAWRWLQATTLALLVVMSSAQAQRTATFPTLPSCPPTPLSLSPCIGYVFGVGSATLDSCCSQLRTFLHAQAPCLCAASKLAPSPVGLILGQAQGIIPNVCNLPNPCDASESTTPASATPSSTDTSPPVAPAVNEVPSTPTTTPSATPASTSPTAETANTTEAADPEGEDDSPAVATAPGQFAPAGTGSKLPELLHAAGATSSRDTAVGTLMITLFLASVAIVYV